MFLFLVCVCVCVSTSLLYYDYDYYDYYYYYYRTAVCISAEFSRVTQDKHDKEIMYRTNVKLL